MRSLKATRPPQPKRDPAPSRWGYRYQRLMLTPGFRKMVRVGLPVLVIGGLVAGWGVFRGPDGLKLIDGVVAMNQAQDLLERDVAVVDMRHPVRPTIRLNEQAVTSLREVNAASD